MIQIRLDYDKLFQIVQVFHGKEWESLSKIPEDIVVLAEIVEEDKGERFIFSKWINSYTGWKFLSKYIVTLDNNLLGMGCS